jgi:hypothetical protein
MLSKVRDLLALASKRVLEERGRRSTIEDWGLEMSASSILHVCTVQWCGVMEG